MATSTRRATFQCNVLYVGIIIALLIGHTTQELYQRRTRNVCRTNGDCPRNSYCEHNDEPTDNGQCVCNHGFVFINGQRPTRECHPVATHLGDRCDFHDQCRYTLSTESECSPVTGTCQCQEGTHFVEREKGCYKSVKIGDFCRLTNNCVGADTACRSGVCHCPENTHPSEDFWRCLTDVEIGNTCNEDAECVADHSRCHNICRCKVSHIVSESKKRCLKVAEQLLDACEETSQCTQNIAHSTCDLSISNGTCTCKPGYHELNYQCWVTVEVGDICETDENCAYYTDTRCVSGRCECAENYQPIDGYCSAATSTVSLDNRNRLTLWTILMTFIGSTSAVLFRSHSLTSC